LTTHNLCNKGNLQQLWAQKKAHQVKTNTEYKLARIRTSCSKSEFQFFAGFMQPATARRHFTRNSVGKIPMASCFLQSASGFVIGNAIVVKASFFAGMGREFSNIRSKICQKCKNVDSNSGSR